MLIGAYGEFWDAHLVEWGVGKRGWQMLGRTGQNLPGLRVVDFRFARGVYVLYDNHGAYYAGLARGAGGLGGRLKDHLNDEHAGRWQRFSWYSFDAIGAKPNPTTGMHEVARRDKPVPQSGESTIRELEALLITVLGTRGQRRMKFQNAQGWNQVAFYEVEILEKVRIR